MPRQVTALQVLSIAMLCALPALLLTPEGGRSVNERQLTRHLAVAIYRFGSDAMPRCDQFVRPTTYVNQARISVHVGPVACQTRRSGFSV